VALRRCTEEAVKPLEGSLGTRRLVLVAGPRTGVCSCNMHSGMGRQHARVGACSDQREGASIRRLGSLSQRWLGFPKIPSITRLWLHMHEVCDLGIAIPLD
jgi:hypothetical protein